jgi:hypothetical protein
MKTKSLFYLTILVILLSLVIFNCKKEPLKMVPTVTASTITNITATTASSGGVVTSDGGASITAQGVCWSKSLNPTISDSKTTDGTESVSFTSLLSGLTEGTKYYLKAYATNSIGTGYSDQSTFSTLAITPILTTTELSAVGSTSASGGGNITSDGGSSVTVRGVCWSTSQNPTISDNKTSDGNGTGSYVSSITGLKPGVTYHFRAYATNSIGTSYGNELTITTTAILPVVTTEIISAVNSTSAASGGNITNDGGAAITARGVCWSTSTLPTILNNKTFNGTGSGSFISSITGLSAGTLYYVRAYATNIIGTSYGNELTITTTAPIAIEWVAPSPGEIIGVYNYANGAMAGESRHQKFNVLNTSGEISIVVVDAALNLSKTTVFNVEIGKQYDMIIRLNYSAEAGGTVTSTKCETFIISSPNCSSTKEVYVSQFSYRRTLYIPPNTSTYYTYACPSSYSIGDISISPVN